MNKESLSTPIFFYTGNEGDIVWFCENTVNYLKINTLLGSLFSAYF